MHVLRSEARPYPDPRTYVSTEDHKPTLGAVARASVLDSKQTAVLRTYVDPNYETRTVVF